MYIHILFSDIKWLSLVRVMMTLTHFPKHYSLFSALLSTIITGTSISIAWSGTACFTHMSQIRASFLDLDYSGHFLGCRYHQVTIVSVVGARWWREMCTHLQRAPPAPGVYTLILGFNTNIQQTRMQTHEMRRVTRCFLSINAMYVFAKVYARLRDKSARSRMCSSQTETATIHGCVWFAVFSSVTTEHHHSFCTQIDRFAIEPRRNNNALCAPQIFCACWRRRKRTPTQY